MGRIAVVLSPRIGCRCYWVVVGPGGTAVPLRVRSGWRAAWEQWIQGFLEAQARAEYVQPFPLVETYLNLGRDAEAIQWLRRAADLRDIEIVFLKVAPRFDRLRSNPRFQEIVRSLNFPP